MTTSEPAPNGGQANPDQEWMWWPEDSPANPSPRPVPASERRMSGGGGRGWPVSFAWYDPVTSSWRTSQLSLLPDEPSEWSLPTWPRSGSMRTGECYPRAPWVHHTHETACSLWPTPTAAMGTHGWGLTHTGRTRYRSSTTSRVHGAIESSRHWRPPILMIETLMGLPAGWLWLVETPSSPTSPNSSHD